MAETPADSQSWEDSEKKRFIDIVTGAAPHPRSPEVCAAIRQISEVLAAAPISLSGYRTMDQNAIVIELVARGIPPSSALEAVHWALSKDCLRIGSREQPKLVHGTITLQQIANGEYVDYLGPQPGSPIPSPPDLATRRGFPRQEAVSKLPRGNADKKTVGCKKKKGSRHTDKQLMLISILTKHYRYAEGGCLEPEPIHNNELARQAKVAKRTASAFFRKEFGSWADYSRLCRHQHLIVAALKALRGEFYPYEFNNARKPDDVAREDD